MSTYKSRLWPDIRWYINHRHILRSCENIIIQLLQIYCCLIQFLYQLTGYIALLHACITSKWTGINLVSIELNNISWLHFC